MKALNENCDKIEPLDPGFVYSSEKGKYRWYNPVWWNPVSLSFYHSLIFFFLKKTIKP